MNEELQEVLEDCDQSMQKAIEAFRRELARIRTGRANLAILDGVRVDYYGSKTPLNQVASLTVADARLITIKPWDRSLLPEIEKAIQAADVGITPSNDGQIIRLPIPPLTGERRRELVRQVWRLAEDAKIAVRNCRRDARDFVDAIDGLPEDDGKRGKDRIQELTNQYVAQVDEIARKKEAEIMEV